MCRFHGFKGSQGPPVPQAGRRRGPAHVFWATPLHVAWRRDEGHFCVISITRLALAGDHPWRGSTLAAARLPLDKEVVPETRTTRVCRKNDEERVCGAGALSLGAFQGTIGYQATGTV